MGGLITAKDVAWAIEHCPEQVAQLLAALIFLTLAFTITYKIHSLINSALMKDQKRNEEIEALKKHNAKLDKQQHKLIQLLTAAPCVTKNNGMWLADEARNGGQPPEPIKCRYDEAKRKVE